MSWVPWVPPGRRPPVDARVIAAAVVAGVVVVVLLGGRGEGPEPDALGDPVARPEAALGALPRLVDLGADKCVACKAMAPILDELRETYEGRLDVIFVDVWQNRAAAAEYRVQVIPTQIFFDPDGSELFRHQGFLSREDILAKWTEFGYAFVE